jgi:ketosteroid isomerase-like protein
MQDINKWLDKFENFWKKHEIDKIMNLFTRDVEYWETPFKKLEGIEQVEKEWQGVVNQEKIKLDFEVFSREEDKYCVIWHLKYEDQKGKEEEFAGAYLVRLNPDNKCYYFFHCCEGYTNL